LEKSRTKTLLKWKLLQCYSIQKFNNEKEISLINDSQYIQDINNYTNAPKLKKIKKKSQNKKEVNEDKKHIVFNPSNNA
jgi:hypothetical protein